MAIKPGFDEVAVTVSTWFSLTEPEPIPLKFTVCAAESSGIVTLLIAASVGGMLARFTLTVKLRTTVLLTACPSSTVTVIVALPLPFAAGVKVKLPVALGLV